MSDPPSDPVPGGPPTPTVAAGIEIPDTDPLRLAFFEQSDLGNADRLIALAGGRLRWVADAGGWAFYDGKRFDMERGEIAAQRLAHDVVRHIRDEASEIYELHRRCEKGEAAGLELLTRLRGPKYDWSALKTLGSGLMKHALKSGSANMTAGMLRQARSALAALAEDFDRDPLVYNVGNGTLRFVQSPPGSAPHTGQGQNLGPADPGRASALGWKAVLSPHDPADLLMQLAEVEFVPEAEAPFWTERLHRLQPDPEAFRALHLLYGYSLTGLTSDQAFYVHQGKGNDGKSATHQALGELHGDYFRHAGVKTFLDSGSMRGGAEHRSDLVRLKGDIRFVTCDEPKARSSWDGETIKQVTGSLITARGANERAEVTFRPTFKLNAECNILPRPPSDDKGFRRRLKLFQWTVSLPLAGEDGHLPIDTVLAQLKAERSGILNWLIAGACEWLTHRVIPQPAAMANVLEDFWSSSSPLLDWMEEWTDCSDPEARTPVRDLWEAFKAWKEENGIETGPGTTTAFGNALRDKQFAVVKDARGVRWRKGIRLLGKDEHDLFVAGAAQRAPVGVDGARHQDPSRAAASTAAEQALGSDPPFASDGPHHPFQPGGLDDDEDLP